MRNILADGPFGTTERGLRYGLIKSGTPQKARNFKPFRYSGRMKYGLKAARRAPQFSKR